MSYSQNDKGQYVVPLVDFGHRLKDNFGLTIREHEAFDPVDNVHSPNSHHYHGNAIDIQDWRDDVIDGVDWRTRTANLETALQGAGVEVFGPNSGVPGHDKHLHLAGFDGNVHLNPEQFEHFFGGDSGGSRSLFKLQPGATGVPTDTGSTSDRGGAKAKAKAYSDMSKGEMDAAYDAIRGQANAVDEGMKMHKAFFKKP